MDMSQEATELLVWLQNEHSMAKHIDALTKNYTKKMANGIFDRELAIKGFLPLVTTAAKAYGDAFLSNDEWKDVFSVQDRKEVATELVDEFVEEYEFQKDQTPAVEEELGVMEAVEDDDEDENDEKIEEGVESDEDSDDEDDLDDDDVYGYIMKNRARNAKVANRPAKTPKPTLGEDNEGVEKYITVTFDRVSEESAENGEAEESGWADERGNTFSEYDDTLKMSMIPDEYDAEEGLTAVDLAVKTLKNSGAYHPNDSHLPTSYDTNEDIDYVSGDRTIFSYHLNGFDRDELVQIKQGLMVK